MDRGWRMAFSKHGARMEKSEREVPFRRAPTPVRRILRRLITDGRDAGAHSAFWTTIPHADRMHVQREFLILPVASDAEVRWAGRTRGAASTGIEAVAPCRASSKGGSHEIIENRPPSCPRLALKVPAPHTQDCAMMATTETLRGVLRTSRGQPLLHLQSADQRASLVLDLLSLGSRSALGVSFLLSVS